MMLFETPIPLWLIALLGVCMLALAIRLALQARDALPSRYIGLLFALRVVVILMACLLAANPYTVIEKPDPESVRIAVLADISESMATHDTEDGTRIETLHQLLDEQSEDSFISQLRTEGTVQVQSFVNELLPSQPGLEPKSGTTAIGKVLNDQLAQSNTGKPLGAVVLISDGISLQGEAPQDAAKTYRAAGIPVTTIGVGSVRNQTDISVTFKDVPQKTPMNELLELKVTVENKSSLPHSATLDLFGNESTALDQKVVTIDPGQKREVVFQVKPEIPGFETYRVRLANPPESDINPENDISYAAVEITPPETIDVLYLSNRITNSYRFLNQMLKGDKEYNLKTFMRLGEDRYFSNGFDKELELPVDQFPTEKSVYLDNRIILMDSSTFSELDENIVEALRSFLEDRSGGLLFMGPPNDTPQDVKTLIPVRDSNLVKTQKREPLQLSMDPVFREAAGGLLFVAPGPYLADDTPAAIATDLSRGARVIGKTEHGNLPVLAIQAYGAGRTAYLGTESLWRWQMTTPRGEEQYQQFWRYLLAWLGEGGKPRIDITQSKAIQPTGEPIALDIRVLGRDFLPAPNAQVRAQLRAPDGQLKRVNLTPSPYEIGLYSGVYQAELPGEYEVDYSVSLPDGERLTRRNYFAAARQGRENEVLTYDEQTLQEVARISGGEYAHYTEAESVLPLKLATGLPKLSESVYWTRNTLFLILLLGLAGLEWFLRRRVGLR